MQHILFANIAASNPSSLAKYRSKVVRYSNIDCWEPATRRPLKTNCHRSWQDYAPFLSCNCSSQVSGYGAIQTFAQHALNWHIFSLLTYTTKIQSHRDFRHICNYTFSSLLVKLKAIRLYTKVGLWMPCPMIMRKLKVLRVMSVFSQWTNGRYTVS